MTKNISFTTEEIATMLRISKLTVYDLIKKGDLPAYRVGRQMRVDSSDLEAYKARAKGGAQQIAELQPSPAQTQATGTSSARSLIISGQDVSLDILAGHLERRTTLFRPLRSFTGSLNGLVSMYRGEADVVSTHLYDGDTGEYNLPYIRRLLVGHRYVVVHLLARWAGFYVQKGNPKGIIDWSDLKNDGIRLVNREKGSGARVLLEEQLRILGISASRIAGYHREERNHLAVAGAVAFGEADVGIGHQKAAQIVNVQFIPLIKERYDLVMLKTAHTEEYVRLLCETVQSPAFQQEITSIGGYDVTDTGKVLLDID